jgi:hypothetical protein
MSSRLRLARAGLAALAAIASVATVAAGCSSLRGPALEDSQLYWKQGRRAESLAMAGEVYSRFLGANDLSDEAVRAELTAAITSLSEDPIFVPGDGPAPVVDAADGRSGVLAAAVQSDLSGERITPVLRGLLVVRDMGLARHAATVLAIVFAERALRADGGVLQGASTAMRNLVAKRLALDTLARLQ